MGDEREDAGAGGDPLLDALGRAVAGDPQNADLRSHYAGVLLEKGFETAALEQAQLVLARRPADSAVLSVAMRAATLVGDSDLASQYEQLLSGLSSSGPGETVPDASSMLDTPDTVDGLLARWDSSDPLEENEGAGVGGPTVRLVDVGGMDEVKRRLELSFFAPLRNPEVSTAFGKSLRGGLLLWGPPGCGKTLIARAVAGELGAGFREVGLSQVLDMWVGSSERNLSSIFEEARATQPCVLFFDELDALGMKRANLRMGGAAMRGVVNQLLAELDGATTDNAGVFVIGATNHPWDVDTALLRPGRFDRRILVLPPDLAARQAILRVCLRGKPMGDVNLDAVARATDGYSGADIALVVDSATERAMERSLSGGAIQPIRQDDLDASVREVRSTIGGWFDLARNYATFNNDDGAYDDLVRYLQRSSQPRGRPSDRRWFR